MLTKFVFRPVNCKLSMTYMSTFSSLCIFTSVTFFKLSRWLPLINFHDDEPSFNSCFRQTKILKLNIKCKIKKTCFFGPFWKIIPPGKGFEAIFAHIVC